MNKLSSNEKELIFRFAKEVKFIPDQISDINDNGFLFWPFFCGEINQYIYIGTQNYKHQDFHTGSVHATGTPKHYLIVIGTDERTSEFSLTGREAFPPTYVSFIADNLEEVQKLLTKMFFSSNAQNRTTRLMEKKQRIGQDDFRDNLISYWGECAVTGLKEATLLRASHIKPWSDSSDEERLDVYNGLLLSANLDAAFDEGLISFDNQGRIIISSRFSAKEAQLAGIESIMQLKRIERQHKAYLVYHRTIFRGNF
jgi:hypothetical protein